MMMMSNQRPNLWRVLSDTSRIISSNSLHFAALSLLFIFPMMLLAAFYTLLILPPSPSPPSHEFSPYRRLLSAVTNNHSDLQIHAFYKSQILYILITLVFNLCAVSSVTTSIFNGLRSKPLKLADSIKSIPSSFLPLLATKLVSFIITVAITFGFGICIGFVFLCLALLGFEIDLGSKAFMAVVLIATILLVAISLCLGVQWCLAYAVVVVESKYGYEALRRSWMLVKGARRVAFLLLMVLGIPQMALSGWFSSVARGSSHGVVAQMLLYAALSTVVGLIGLSAIAVLLVQCKEFNGETEEMEFGSDHEKKLGQLYVPLPHQVVDEV